MLGESLFPYTSDGISRKAFLKLCSLLAVTIGLPASAGELVAQQLKRDDKRPSVIWLPLQECTGCTETLLRATHPEVSELILDIISLEYHETLMAAAGHQAEKTLDEAVKNNRGRYFLVVDGSVPLKDNGIYCKIGGRNALDLVNKTASDAVAIIAMGSCSSWGGLPSAHPNPTGAVGIREALVELGIKKPVISLPGCPPNPYNLLSTVAYVLTFGLNRLVKNLDAEGRPLFAYGKTIHNHCERKPHFDAGRFVKKFGDSGHQKGWCLYLMGCKGPVTHANCNAQNFNDVGVWPVSVGAPCYGCTEKGYSGFNFALKEPPKIAGARAPKIVDGDLLESFPRVGERKERGSGSMVAAAVAGAAIGTVAGFASALAAKLPTTDVTDEEEAADESKGQVDSGESV